MVSKLGLAEQWIGEQGGNIAPALDKLASLLTEAQMATEELETTMLQTSLGGLAEQGRVRADIIGHARINM